jgi:integrase/recombinase XerD
MLPYLVEAGIDDLAGLTAEALNRFSVGLLDGTASRSGRPLSKDTVRSYARTVNVWLAWAALQAKTTPVAKVALPKRRKPMPDTLTRAEMRAMEDAADSERDKLIVRLLSETGMRAGELLGLEAADVRRIGRKDHVRVLGKGDIERLVPVSAATASRLRRRPAGTTSSKIFLGNRRSARTGEYEPLTLSGVDQMIRDLAVKAGITKRVYPHLFRHSFITEWLRGGFSLALLVHIVGHTSSAMITSTYEHLLPGDAAAEHMRYLLLE